LTCTDRSGITSNMTFYTPPLKTNSEKKPRRVGFELEFTDADIKTCSELIADLFGGKVRYENALEAEVIETPMGKFKVELDAQILKKLAARLEQEKLAQDVGIVDMERLQTEVSSWIGQAAGQVVPYEIVTPPLTFDQLPKLETLRQKLQERNAKGSKAGFFNAFGMHINPEAASEEVDYIRDILCAFLVLYPWLKKVMKIDLSRRMLTYIDPFPEAYVRLLLAENYSPSLEDFILDYLKHSPTRNRALDLLPLFDHLKPDLLDGLEEGQRKLVKGRPAFHYRLPNCEIDDPDWRISRDWNYWVEVEKLAYNSEKLRSMCVEYLEFQNDELRIFETDWALRVAELMDFEP